MFPAFSIAFRLLLALGEGGTVARVDEGGGCREILLTHTRTLTHTHTTTTTKTAPEIEGKNNSEWC